MKRAIKWSLAIILVAAIAATIYLFTRPSWPDFPATTEVTPQSKTSVKRDYAHRIGDVIPLELVIRQQVGTRVQMDSLTIAGDFELHEKPTLDLKEFKDGSALYRVCFKLQSFEPKARLSFKVAIAWDDLEKNEQAVYETPEVKRGTSMTWDGRKEMQEGDDALTLLWASTRAPVPLTAGVVLYLAVVFMAVRRWWLFKRQPSEAELIHNRFVELLGTVRSGTASCEVYQELELIVRKRWHVEAIPVEELQKNLHEPAWREAVQDFLKGTALGIYPLQQLSNEQQLEIASMGERLKAALLQPAPATQAPATLPAELLAQLANVDSPSATGKVDSAALTAATAVEQTPSASDNKDKGNSDKA